MAEIRPYSPSWRDRLAAALMGGERASPERRRFVEGLLGSSGLGPSGASIADFTPAGVVFAGDEFQRAKNDGSASGAAMAAMGLIPAARGAAIPAQTALAEGAQGIRAYHGSPHSFDRFDINKIGTGEGAQAYGHGLYFAQSEPVAMSYRDVLSKSGTEGAQRRLQRSGGDIDKAIADTAALAERYRVGGANNYAAVAEEDLRFLQKYKETGKWTPGHMYEVNIRANPEDFLDWDKPLTEQAKAIEALRPIIGNVSNPGYGVGPALRDARKYMNMADDPRRAEELLSQAGIPGIKYLDQGSRGTGEGSRNYVVFDDKLIDILRKYGLAGLSIGGAGGLATSNGLLGPSINEGM